MPLIVLIGASGSGKTAIAEAIAVRHGAECDVLHFDRIGVPSVDEMIADHGSAEAWQRAKTIEWFGTLAAIVKPQRGLLFEGQTRLAFLDAASEAVGSLAYVPILVDWIVPHGVV